jgi:hypothetical protein
MDLEPGSLIGTDMDAVKRWLTGAAQRLQEAKNLKGRTGSTSLAEKAEGIEGQSLIHEDVWRQWEKECLDAMNKEIEVKSLLISRSRGIFQKDRKPTKEELHQQSKWVVEEMGSNRKFQAVNDKSWIWQMHCLLSKERRVMTMYPEYEAFMLGSVKRLEKSVQEQAQMGRMARIVDVSIAKRVTTSHGQGNIEIAEVIDVEADESALLGEEDFTPLKFFSREGDSDCDCEVDYDSDSQKGISAGSPCSFVKI